MSDFETGVIDCKNDLADGFVPAGGPTEIGAVTLDYLVNELRVTMGASDAYIAGYLSAFYG
jgi:hypothetical protein